MKTSTCLVILGLVTLVSCSNVVNLTDQNFKSTIQGHKYVMVKFFAPWCGHCKTMVPEYEKLADLAKDNGVIIGEVDATISKDTAQAYQVQGYPTIKFFINGVDIDYKGPRKADEMYGWIKKVTETVLEQVSQEKIDELKTKQNLVVYFGSNEQKRKTIELLNIADGSIDYYVSPSEEEKLVLYPLGKQPIVFSSELSFTNDEIRKWAMINTIPTVVPLSSKDYLDWVFYDEATMKPVAMLLRQSDLTEEGYKKFEQLCESNKETFKCCVVQQSHEVYGGVKNYLRSSGSSVLALTRDGLQQAYAYPNNINELTEQSWKTFTTEIQEGKFKNLAAKQEPKIQYNHVKVLTDSNFTSFIKENEVAFVEFYTTSCGHCVEFSKQYDEIAKKVYADESLNYQIAALDIKKNKQVAAELQITSFPTFRLYISGYSVLYDGPRTEEAILAFIKTVKQSKPIPAGSIAEVPSPSVVIYDPAETSSIKFLPALFTRYPVYHIREGEQLKIVLRLETEETYNGELDIVKITKWLFKKTDPILVDLLNSNVENKLREALQNKIAVLGLIDVDPALSTSLKATFEEYCKQSSLVCGLAKKDNDNFNQFIKWVGVEADSSSKLIYLNTQTFDRYLFPRKIEQLSNETITQFLSDLKDGKIKSITDSKAETEKENKETKPQTENPQQETQEQQSKEEQEEPESKQTVESEKKPDQQL